MDSAALTDLIEGNDLDGLVRFVDRLAGARDWDGLVTTRDRCREAVGRGKQLWAAAEFAEYRLALEAPGPYAGAVLVEGAGRFALGPFWEVAASTHTWDELAAHVPPGRMRTLVAHERAVRGEDLAAAPGVDHHLLELPLRLEPWEPAYPPAVYRADKADFPEPDYPPLEAVKLTPDAPRRDDPVGLDSLYELVKPWVDQSNGRAEVAAVEGGALEAFGAFGLSRAWAAELTAAEAMAFMAWTGASGGAHGRRRGTPVGRHDAWWAVVALAGRLDDWPLPGSEVGELAAGLRWFRLDPGDRSSGWSFHLAAEDAAREAGWAISAVDAV